MSELEVEGVGTFEVEEGKRLVLLSRRMAGSISCTPVAPTPSTAPAAWCFLGGEPEYMTEGEMNLDMRDLPGEARLSCQIHLDHY